MKIRICSDLHVDVNKTTDFGFNGKINETDLTIIAGDIAGSYQNEQYFLRKLGATKPVICVGGNHLGYDYLIRSNRFTNPFDGIKEYSLITLKDEFNGPIYYLENDDIIIEDKLIFGGTMYTDFNLYDNYQHHSRCGEAGLNDFRYVYTVENENVRPVTSEDYIRWFNQFMNNLKLRIEETKDSNLDIIVVTHFAPSANSISEKYMGRYDYLNPSYASNLEEFIKGNPRIKLWVHGHMHDSFDYTIGQCRVICEPFGYVGENLYNSENYNGKIIEI